MLQYIFGRCDFRFSGFNKSFEIPMPLANTNPTFLLIKLLLRIPNYIFRLTPNLTWAQINLTPKRVGCSCSEIHSEERCFYVRVYSLSWVHTYGFNMWRLIAVTFLAVLTETRPVSHAYSYTHTHTHDMAWCYLGSFLYGNHNSFGHSLVDDHNVSTSSLSIEQLGNWDWWEPCYNHVSRN